MKKRRIDLAKDAHMFFSTKLIGGTAMPLIMLLVIMVSNCCEAVVIQGSKLRFDLVSPTLKPGIDTTAGNWVDTNLVTWSKMSKVEPDYEGAKLVCENKGKSDSLQWQLPTPEQAGSFYRHLARPIVLTRRGWQLGPIWLADVGTDKTHEIADLFYGTLYLNGVQAKTKIVAACIALPQGFDKSGNYFDGKLSWSKTSRKSYTIAEAKKRCADMNSGSTSLPQWKLPTFEQLNASLGQPLQSSELFRQKFKKNGWAFGTALVQSQSNSENYKLLYTADNSHIVTCVR